MPRSPAKSLTSTVASPPDTQIPASHQTTGTVIRTAHLRRSRSEHVAARSLGPPMLVTMHVGHVRPSTGTPPTSSWPTSLEPPGRTDSASAASAWPKPARRIGYDPGVDRPARHLAVLPGRPGRSGHAAAAPRCRRPPTSRWPRTGRTRTPSRPAGRSPARMVPVTPVEKFLQRLRDDRRDRAPRGPGVLPDGRRQPARQPDGEHRGWLGNRDRPRDRSLADIPARLPLRAAQPPGQHCPFRDGVRGRWASYAIGCQRAGASGGIGPPRAGCPSCARCSLSRRRGS
jgi:hypothetical protein